jgi:hypothetical protein
MKAAARKSALIFNLTHVAEFEPTTRQDGVTRPGIAASLRGSTAGREGSEGRFDLRRRLGSAGEPWRLALKICVERDKRYGTKWKISGSCLPRLLVRVSMIGIAFGGPFNQQETNGRAHQLEHDHDVCYKDGFIDAKADGGLRLTAKGKETAYRKL